MKREYLIYIIIGIIFTFNIGTFIYLNYKLTGLETKTSSALGDIRTTLIKVDKDREEIDQLTVEGVLESYKKLEAVVEVYDNNVAIYNSQITDLYSKVDSIVKYLNANR
jgi:hypothetical protein